MEKREYQGLIEAIDFIEQFIDDFFEMSEIDAPFNYSWYLNQEEEKLFFARLRIVRFLEGIGLKPEEISKKWKQGSKEEENECNTNND